jgi:hypothetical protein
MMERKMTQAAKFAVLDAITTALGFEASVTKRAAEEPGVWAMAWQHVALPEGSISLHYHEDRKGDYVEVSGDWPRDHAGTMVQGRDAEHGATTPRINASVAKRPDAIARDIRRRFLPAFAPLYAKALAVVQARNAYEAAVIANYQALADAGGGRFINEHGRRYLRDLPEGVEVKYVNDKRVDLVLSCSIEEACAGLRARVKGTPKKRRPA